MAAEPTVLNQWETFYVIVGSSGGALTGLLFVVVALAADRVQSTTSQGLSTFTTPSVFHFCVVLFVSAAVAMPRAGLASLAVLLGASAIVGGTVTVFAVRHMAVFERYRPVAEDWIWHGAIPCVAYLGLLIAAIVLTRAPAPALYIVGSVCLALLFVGIHNAWDAAIYSAVNLPRDAAGPKPPGQG